MVRTWDNAENLLFLLYISYSSMPSDRLTWSHVGFVHRKLTCKFSGFSQARTLSLSMFITSLPYCIRKAFTIFLWSYSRDELNESCFKNFINCNYKYIQNSIFWRLFWKSTFLIWFLKIEKMIVCPLYIGL